MTNPRTVSTTAFRKGPEGYAPPRFARLFLMLSVMILSLCSHKPAQANIAFSLKYRLPCARCHSMVPRLNPYGYAFYRAGFRLPGPNKPMTLANSVSLMSDVVAMHTEPDRSDTLTDESVKAAFVGTLNKNITLHAAYLFSLRSTTTSGFDEIWMQYNTAAKGTFWSVRVGQLPVLDGYNLLGNREFSLTDPQALGAFGPLSGNLNLSDVERGFEFGYTSGPLSVRLSWLNGINEDGEGAVSLPGNRFHDYLLQSDYLIGKEGSMIGAFVYLGKTPLSSAGYTNSFQRAGLVGTWAKILRPGKLGIPAMLFELNGGVLWGEDQTSAEGLRQNSLGGILEADLYLHNRTAFFLRYDGARSPTTSGTPTSDAFTAGVAHQFTRNFKAELEYRNQRAPYGATAIAGFSFSL